MGNGRESTRQPKRLQWQPEQVGPEAGPWTFCAWSGAQVSPVPIAHTGSYAMVTCAREGGVVVS
jgi:hypothetical protein